MAARAMARQPCRSAPTAMRPPSRRAGAPPRAGGGTHGARSLARGKTQSPLPAPSATSPAVIVIVAELAPATAHHRGAGRLPSPPPPPPPPSPYTPKEFKERILRISPSHSRLARTSTTKGTAENPFGPSKRPSYSSGLALAQAPHPRGAQCAPRPAKTSPSAGVPPGTAARGRLRKRIAPRSPLASRASQTSLNTKVRRLTYSST